MVSAVAVASQGYSIENDQVVVELYESPQNRTRILNFPRHLLQLYTPSAANFVEQGVAPNSKKLRIKVKSLETADQVETPGLRHLFRHMSVLQQSGSLSWTSLPQWTTVREGVGLYRALQMLYLYAEAEQTRTLLVRHMKENPLHSLDVEVLWRVYGSTGELFDPMLRNIAYFKAWDMLPDEEWIFWFMETELLEVAAAQREDIWNRYRAHKTKAEWEFVRLSKARGLEFRFKLLGGLSRHLHRMLEHF
ncbi:hypothetical protein K505DRAFT_93231 [Melanomma pulvis-pyrius CBS 109.77]|uniref:BTB domain-containing protein n=1 Tax=Melanomma pulvis-pyrius CBS 109.77 TaxID=1314802 RepID=A0A6A6WZV7_9PLEO|nr:hypothetical protein K505DRAFT_93231 [Melanomma pulvis-pyrius CBS 109.77]